MPSFVSRRLALLRPAGVVVLAILTLALSVAAASAEYEPAAETAAKVAPYRILVTNDDGIESPGLAALVEALAPLGDITIVAPLENQSGIGHALNLRNPIFPMRREVAGRPAVALTGTPATCVRVAIDNLMKDAPPDLVVSGVNRGLNFGRNAYISGTVAAAREAALQGIASIAVSLDRARDQNYTAAAQAAAEVAAVVKEHGLPQTVFLNVNVPISATEGLKLTHQSLLAGTESFEARKNPYGRPYFWSFFEQPTAEAEPGSDIEAVRNGYVAVTPLQARESADEAFEALAVHFEALEPASPERH